ncbi:MAG: response regulator [Opitutaceae bacterium]
METRRTRILIVEDHKAVAEMMRIVVEEKERFEVVGEVVRADRICGEVGRLRPDVVVLDLDLGGTNTLDLLGGIREARPEASVLVFSGKLRLGAIRRAMIAGAQGIVEKTAPLAEFYETLEAVADGKCHYSRYASEEIRRLVQRPAGGPRLVRLTSRDKDVLRAMAEGCASKEIAFRLGLSPFTVVNHRTRLSRKLGIRGLAQLTRYAVSLGLVSDRIEGAPEAI